MKSFRIYLICICTIAVGLTAPGCATDLSDDGLGGAEGGLDYSVDAVDSADLSSDEELEAEAADFVAKPAGTCKCNPAPDSTGRYRFKSETCSLCTNSADCATASCIYEHRVHGGEKNVKCHFKSGTMTVDELETIELEELDGSEEQDSLDRSDALAAPGTCSCNRAPDSSGNWAIGKENCSLCTDSASCSTAKCWYKHSVHGGLKNVGCRFRSGGIFTDPIDRFNAESDQLDTIELDEQDSEEDDSDFSSHTGGTCRCTAAPDSSGDWVLVKDKCSVCTNSRDCSYGSCIYKHRVHGGKKYVGCRYSTVMTPYTDDEGDEAQFAAQDSDNSFSMASSCICNPAPSSQGGWYVSSTTCKECTDSADCSATGRCWYTNSDGDEQQVGCHWGSKPKMKKKKMKMMKMIGNTDDLDF